MERVPRLSTGTVGSGRYLQSSAPEANDPHDAGGENEGRNSMRTITTVVSALTVLGIMTGGAAASDQTRFDSEIRKFANDGGNTQFRAVCVCASTTPNGRDNDPGFVLLQNGKVLCSVPFFAPDGSFVNGNTCSDFVVLGK
jgi:hypothetical protein